MQESVAIISVQNDCVQNGVNLIFQEYTNLKCLSEMKLKYEHLLSLSANCLFHYCLHCH